MGQGLHLSQNLEIICSLSQFIGEESGDIPIYSLHRLRRVLETKPMPVHSKLQEMFLTAALDANTRYREESGNGWYCLTSNYLVIALETLESELERINSAAIAAQTSNRNLRKALQKALEQARIKCIHDIRDWFEVNYDELLYNRNGSVPWPVVQRLRRDLKIWAWGVSNPFGQSIYEMVLEVAEENKVNCSDAESAWKAMGGKIHKNKK